MGKVVERIVNAERVEDLITVFGSFDENIKRIEDALTVRVVNRGTDLRVSGDEEMTDKAVRTLEGLLSLAAKGETIDEQRVRYLITLVNEGNDAQVAQMAKDVVCITAKGKPIKAKTVGQQNYMKAIMKNTITIGVGPAGTGKTYLAVAAAVAAFRERTVNRIILTRPAVEAGERLGFLPGDLQNKVDPYLRPLYDALYDMLGAETFQKYQERGSIEVAPLAYMRGRTLDDSFIILDEAQNTTREQMKMFLTRLGFGSKIVITGDVTQIDLPDDKVSGLKDAVRVLDGVKDIAICRLTAADVVRHALVQEIISAYERSAQKKEVKNRPVRFRVVTIRGRIDMRHKINIVFEQLSLQKFAIKSIIRTCINAVLDAEGINVPCEINVLVTDDAGIQVVNRESRHMDKPTDVLSFPMFQLIAGEPPTDWTDFQDPETGLVPLGDMCISLERAIAQAKEFGHSTRREVGYLTIHSMLHLLGYDHLDEGEEKKKMRGREEAIAASIPNMSRD